MWDAIGYLGWCVGEIGSSQMPANPHKIVKNTPTNRSGFYQVKVSKNRVFLDKLSGWI